MSQDTVPPALRASDEDRENVIGQLRDGSVRGRLSHETFLQRVDAALRARRLDDLAGLLRDLPPPARRDGWRERTGEWWSVAGHRVQAAWRARLLPVLVLPREDRAFVIGRDPRCDFPIADPTVSWRHAELRCSASGWLLADLDSTNGTWVNGWRAAQAFSVQPGDCVRFGRAGFRLGG